MQSFRQYRKIGHTVCEHSSEEKINTNDGKIVVISEGSQDPTDPRSWSSRKRYWNLFMVCFLVFAQVWAGAANSLADNQAAAILHVSQVAESLETSIYLIGVGFGAFFAGPLSEAFGRNPVYIIATFIYMLFVAGTGVVDTYGGQITCRFFVGLFASATLTINGGSINDQFSPLERSYVFPILALANIAPVALSPVVGGWMVQRGFDYRSADWVSLLISGPAWILALFWLPETYQPILVQWKTKHLRRVTEDTRYTCHHESRGSLSASLKELLPRPLIFWTKEPVIIILGIYLVLLSVLLFTFLSGFEFLFARTYGFSVGQEGTVFVAIAVGALVGTCLTPLFYLLAEGPNATLQPETRLWSAIIAAPFLAISIFWLGWTNYTSISPWSGIMACFVFGYALIGIYISAYQYIIDSYGQYAASALASITVVRYWVAAGIHVASLPMFEGIGTHWTLTLVGIIAALLVPAPYIFYKYGAKVRSRSEYASGH
ncbi:MFS general substrate transporter [Saccharata proteae CBS 121410]|uniref:MFS general substrate transporter n=1 Tax=Saccharata proteae CBS 121410 TaxID=1314787 RepID=A0A9P4HUH3_9PEZI|nr:MFS general substrate transporter [Saccharata proteae CBS 121410]